MKHKYLVLFAALLMIAPSLRAQYETVVFDYERSWFNDGRELPAESKMTFTSSINSSIELVELSFFRPKTNKEKAPLYRERWRRSYGNTAEVFTMPVNFKLRGNTDYDVVISYFRGVSDAEKENLSATFASFFDAYLLQSVVVSNDRIRLNRSRNQLLSDLNTIIQDGMVNYRHANGQDFPGFSDVIKGSIDNLNGVELPAGSLTTGEDMSPLRQQISGVNSLLMTELDQYLNGDMMVMVDVREINDYGTEKTRGTIALNAGFGGVYLDGNLKKLSYDAAPYLGVSLPLGNKATGNAFWANTSLSVGAFVSNFENSEGDVVTGPIFGRPYYVGLGYSVFRFIRINAGATLLEEQGSSSIGGGTASVSTVMVRPFLGVSAELELWLGLRDKR
jgi:hypothetical protein